jgi:nitroreductase
METLEAIMTRRSVPKVTQQEIAKDTIEALLSGAVRAPCHHLTEPWRFVVLTGPARDRLGEVWAAAELQRGRDPEKVRGKPLRAPVIVTVIGAPKTHLPKVQELEEHHSIGAAIQNMLLLAHDMGLGAMIRTGKASEYPEIRDHLGVSDNEYIAGFVYLGIPDGSEERPMTRRTPAQDLTEWRGWE